MTRTPSRTKTRLGAKAGSRSPIGTVLPDKIEPRPEPKSEHPHQNLDRAARAAVARLTGGVSSHAFIEAWSDWALHMSRSPGRQLELVERAQQNALRLMAHATGVETGRGPLFAPKAYDHRFAHPGWQKQPFRAWQQGFLAIQDWWDHATDHSRGMRPEDADRTRFMIRQMLDVMSPSNFPGLNPEIIEATAAATLPTRLHFIRNYLKTIVQVHKPAPIEVPGGGQPGEDHGLSRGRRGARPSRPQNRRLSLWP